MKSKLLFLCLVFTQVICAQTFTEISTVLSLEGVRQSSIAFSDVNTDGSKDVLITGQNVSDQHIAKLYINDGIGNFTEMTGTPFDGVRVSSIAFSDVNGDGSDDVLITGDSGANNRSAKLYINDGVGNFTEMMGTSFVGVSSGSIAFSDVNSDGADDVLITGSDGTFERAAKLYINDGVGNFTEMTGTPFDGVRNSSIAFSDANGDGSDDVLITGDPGGNPGGSEPIAKLYTNDGLGNFTEMTGTPFDGVFAGSIAFSDVNGDGSDDVLITGWNGSFDRIAKLYTNDGLGNFTEITGIPFDGVQESSIAFSDINGDGSDDVLITGLSSFDQHIAKLYINDGLGNFAEMTGTPFEGLRAGSLAFSDVNGDGLNDVLITGQNISNERITKLYTNDGMVSSTENIENHNFLELIIYPNPAASGILYLDYDATEKGRVTIKVFNIEGVLVSQQKEIATLGQQTFPIDIASLFQGSYFIELDNGKRKRVVRKFIIQ